MDIVYIKIITENLNKPTANARLTGELDRWVAIRKLLALLCVPPICTLLLFLQAVVIVCAQNCCF